LAFKIVKIYPHPLTFSLRFFKSDRLLDDVVTRLWSNDGFPQYLTFNE
jgi:hypothetical protein